MLRKFQVIAALLSAVLPAISTAQQQPVRLYLLACFDFKAHADVFDASDLYRQKEIYATSQLLFNLHPDKVFLPYPTDRRQLEQTDSMYRSFCSGDSTRHQDARIQLGFRTASRLRHHKVFSYGYAPDSSFRNSQLRLLAEKYRQRKLLAGKERGSSLPAQTSFDNDSLLKILSLKEYLAFLNAKARVMQGAFIKTAVWPRIGRTHLLSDEGPDFAGAKLLSAWYTENIMLYAAILSQLDFGEKALLIITDPERISLLRHLFESNPTFQVVPPDSWLGKSPLP